MTKLKTIVSFIKQNKLKIASSLLCAGFITNYAYRGAVDKNMSQVYKELASSKKVRNTQLGDVTEKSVVKKIDFDIKMQDPAMKNKWGLKIMKAEKAWAQHNTLGKNIVIAIIDTGIDEKHTDLKNNLWTNLGESGLDKNGKDKATNGIDDDQNGYTDDIHGWNFVNNNNKLKDNHGHGTHIAGIVAAEKGNAFGVSGIAPKAEIMVLKYYDPSTSGKNNLLNTVKSIRYAIAMNKVLKKQGKKMIINYSGGGLEPSPAEKNAISEANKNGILFVAAAGNEESNSDHKSYYPADYKLSNIISVTAINKDKNVLSSSNYGQLSVDIAAPGNDILSTLPNNKFGKMTGTSQATAFVTGVAALIMSKFPDFSAEKVIKHITVTGNVYNQLNGKTRYKTILNTYRALAILDNGVAVNGAVANNTSEVQQTFSVQPNYRQKNSLNSFAKDLGKALETVN